MKVKDCYVRYISGGDIDFLFEESGYEYDPVKGIGRGLVLMVGGEIKAVLDYRHRGENLTIIHLQIFDPAQKCTKIISELFKRVVGFRFVRCIVSEYEVAECVCLRDSGFDCISKGKTLVFTRENGND